MKSPKEIIELLHSFRDVRLNEDGNLEHLPGWFGDDCKSPVDPPLGWTGMNRSAGGFANELCKLIEKHLAPDDVASDDIDYIRRLVWKELPVVYQSAKWVSDKEMDMMKIDCYTTVDFSGKATTFWMVPYGRLGSQLRPTKATEGGDSE